MNWTQIVTHPLTTLFAGMTAIAQLSFGVADPVISLLSSTSAFWFPAAATSGATILPEIGYPGLGTKLLLTASVVFVGVNINRLIDKTQQWLENR